MINDFETLRECQTVGGETYPRHFFIGREAMKEVRDISGLFINAGIDLRLIPGLAHIEHGIAEKSLEDGKVVGVVRPASEGDKPQVIVYQQDCFITYSILRFTGAMPAWEAPTEVEQTEVEPVEQLTAGNAKARREISRKANTEKMRQKKKEKGGRFN